MENYEQKFKIGDSVKGVRTFNGEIIEGKFNGFCLHNKLNPNSVIGVIMTNDGCYDVSVDSIELAESENEKISKEIISWLKSTQYVPNNQVETLNSWITWLKKQGEQKSEQEWSKEDKQMIQDAIHWIQEFQKSDRCKDENDMQNSVTCENWLKSFKPQIARWRPSEYDISLLEEIARNIRNDVRPFCSEVSALEDLINELKNL